MKNYLAKISYDGTNFRGWQIQKKGRTVQQTIEDTLSVIAKTKIHIISAGRTDAGVHALGQYANFNFPIKMSTKQIHLALQANLPTDIQILHIINVPPDFNARFNAVSRKYKYFIAKERTPFNRDHKSYFPRKDIHPEIVKNCLKFFKGKHDFTSFSKLNPDLKNHICNILEFKFSNTENEYIFEIKANRFLHNMVRRIVGTIVNISHKKRNPEIISDLINANSTSNKLIQTAPPNGLYLLDVEYPTIKL